MPKTGLHSQAVHASKSGSATLLSGRTVRHRVENLTRRGNVFYWRARVPSAFRRIGLGQRLSMSLLVSDHHKAGLMARRLNTLLATLAQTPDAMTTTKEKLAAFCQAERDRMAEYLDDAAMVARRSGRVRDSDDIAHDVVAGWSFRLMEHFGFKHDLTFEEDCPALNYLKAEGIAHKGAIDEIKANFNSDRRGYQGKAFDREMSAALNSHLIEDTAPNRERAKVAYLKGRADALMDFASRYALPHESPADLVKRALDSFEETPSLGPFGDNAALACGPEVDGNSSGSEPDAGQIERVTGPIDAVAATDPTPAIVGDDRPAIGVGEETGSQSPVSHGETAATAPVPFVDTAPEDEWDPSFFEDTTSDLRLDGAEHRESALPIAEFDGFVEKIIANRREHWTKETAADFRAAVNLFSSVLIEHGVSSSGEIRQRHLGAYRDHLNSIPTHWGKSPRMKRMSAPDLRQEGAILIRKAKEKTAAEASTKKLVGLHANTIRKHFGNIKHFLEGLHGYGYRLTKMTFRGLRPPKPKKGENRFKTVKVRADDLIPIFQSPLYTGCSAYMGDARVTPGPLVFHDSMYWLPMLYIYLGARRSELAYLMTDDIEHDPTDGWIMHIRPNKYRGLKNTQTHRAMPLPDEVIRLGFLDYRAAIVQTGSDLLFPDLCSASMTNNQGDAFYKDFQAFLAVTLDEHRWDRAIHALRHGFANMLKQSGVSTEQIDELSGRMGDTETSTRYTAPQEIQLQRKLLANLPNVTAHLDPMPVRLAPWVEDGSARPRMGRVPKKVDTAI